MTTNPSTLTSLVDRDERSRFWRELFGNSLHFPVANILLELFAEGGWRYLLAIDFYLLLFAGGIQAWVLVRWDDGRPWRRLVGNLIGPLVYTLVEAPLEGREFFAMPNHSAYWIFSLGFGLVQALQRWLPHSRDIWVVAESILRSLILLSMYIIFDVRLTYGSADSMPGWGEFFSDASHVYLSLLTILLGVINGFAERNARRYLQLLRQISLRLQQYSEWLFGKQLLETIFTNPAALSLKRKERAILFMDLRGFTAWSEQQAPEEVVRLLNKYYQLAEQIAERHEAIKVKFTGDEVLAVFHSVDAALQVALQMQERLRALMMRYGVEAGVGIHWGLVIEGVVGGREVKGYDVLGDTVNTAKRIESAARGGEVLISEQAYRMRQQTHLHGERMQLAVKGKSEPLVVYKIYV